LYLMMICLEIILLVQESSNTTPKVLLS
jgi:hypothetical protein